VPGDDYSVIITAAASKGYYQGGVITDPALSPITLDSTNNVIKLKMDGLISDDLVLGKGTYSSGDALAREIQRALIVPAMLWPGKSRQKSTMTTASKTVV